MAHARIAHTGLAIRCSNYSYAFLNLSRNLVRLVQQSHGMREDNAVGEVVRYSAPTLLAFTMHLSKQCCHPKVLSSTDVG